MSKRECSTTKRRVAVEAAASMILGQLIVTAGLAGGCGRLSTARPAGDALRAEVPQWLQVVEGDSVQDLGLLEGGKPFEHVVRFVNRGPEVVRLSDDIPITCGCAEPKLSKLKLSPGEEGQMTLTIQPAAQNVNRQSAFAFLRAVEPAELPPVRFGVVFDTVMAWTVSPTELRFIGQCGEAQEVIFRVFGSGLRDVTITNIDSDLPQLTFDFEEATVRQGTHALVRGNFVLPRQAGKSSFHVVVETDDPDVPQRGVPVFCTVVSKYRVVPPELLVVYRHEKRQIDRHVLIRSDEPFSLEVPEGLEHPGLTISAPSVGCCQPEHQLTVSISDAAPLCRLHRHCIRLTARSSLGVERIDLPILIVVDSPMEECGLVDSSPIFVH